MTEKRREIVWFVQKVWTKETYDTLHLNYYYMRLIGKTKLNLVLRTCVYFFMFVYSWILCNIYMY